LAALSSSEEGKNAAFLASHFDRWANRQRLVGDRVEQGRIEMATRHRRREPREADASIGQRGVRASPGVLAELGGVEVGGHLESVALMRGEAWGMRGEADAALVAVEEGFVLISTDTCNGNGRQASRRVVVATAQEGMLLAPPGPGERIEALTPCRIQIVSADALKVLLSLPSAAEAIADAFAEALRDRQTTIRNCAYVRHSERVFEKLLQLARTYGRVVPDGVRIDFPLTHQLLADMVGSARETVSLALAELGREELLDCRRHRYVLKIAPHDLFSTFQPHVGSERAALSA
jgi:CRP-like cAMP-binding protein